MVSICSGVFVLAATGLLDGKLATTHWRYAGRLAARHPQIRVDADRLYIDEGSILTPAAPPASTCASTSCAATTERRSPTPSRAAW